MLHQVEMESSIVQMFVEFFEVNTGIQINL